MSRTNRTMTHGCRAETKTGKPCRMAPLKGSDWCFAHDPDRVSERAVARVTEADCQTLPVRSFWSAMEANELRPCHYVAGFDVAEFPPDKQPRS
jgi:hypothetical protein